MGVLPLDTPLLVDVAHARVDERALRMRVEERHATGQEVGVVAVVLVQHRDVRGAGGADAARPVGDRKSTRLNSSHANISYAVFCLKKKKKQITSSMSY